MLPEEPKGRMDLHATLATLPTRIAPVDEPTDRPSSILITKLGWWSGSGSNLRRTPDSASPRGTDHGLGTPDRVARGWLAKVDASRLDSTSVCAASRAAMSMPARQQAPDRLAPVTGGEPAHRSWVAVLCLSRIRRGEVVS